MTERGILFSAPMVRAILAGTKTQTRRAVKWPLLSSSDGSKRRIFVESDAAEINGLLRDPSRHPCRRGFCPYGQPGGQLWVRETWARDDEDGAIMFRADLGRDINADAWEQGRVDGVPRYRWRPSIFMPRWASRITLEVTGVRVERVQDISRGDAMAEGCPFANMARGDDPRHWYAELWGSIHGPGSWDANPWVWVIEFKRVDPR